MKNADCTSIASAYVSTKISLSFGMMTSFRLVMPPNTKNSANTKTRRSGASTPAAAGGVGLDDEVLRRPAVLHAGIGRAKRERVVVASSARRWRAAKTECTRFSLAPLRLVHQPRSLP